jgi:hypothetical protein
MAEKRILNTSTGKYYKIRERNTKYGDKGEIMGLWHNEKGSSGKQKTPPRDNKARSSHEQKKEMKKRGFFAWLFGN